MLLGQFDGKIGEKSRVAFPKRFREILGDKLIITLGFENALTVVSESSWNTLLGDIEESPFTTSGNREAKRFLLGGAAFIELDDKGRFIMPEFLKKYALLTEDIMFIGLSKYVEIWDKKRWENYQTRLAENIAALSERLEQKKNG